MFYKPLMNTLTPAQVRATRHSGLLRRLSVGLLTLLFYSVAATAGSISGTTVYQTVPGSVDLNVEGTADWKHWGRNIASDVNSRANGGGQISNLTMIGGATINRFTGNAAKWTSHSWTNGTPLATGTSFPGGVYTAQNAGGYQFTVPAGNVQRTLKVYLGASSSTSQVTATLSDNSASPYVVNIAEVSSADHYIVTITYQGDSPTSTLTVKQVHTGGTTAIIGLQAATLVAAANQPPSISPIGNRAATVGSPLSFNISASDPDGPPNLVLTMPTVTPSVPAGLNFTDNGSGSGTVTWTPTSGQVGTWAVTFRARDNSGAGLFSESTINIVVSAAGSAFINGSTAYQATPGSVNLTTEGIADWKHWGRNVVSDVNRKATGGSQISNLTMIGGAIAARFPGNAAKWTTHSWSDGTPQATGTGFPGGIFTSTNNGGFEFTAPADNTTTRTLKVYLGNSSANSRVEVSLSDPGSPTYNQDIPQGSSADHYIVTLNYMGSSPTSTIRVRYIHTGGTANIVGIQAATLSTTSNNPPTLSNIGNQTVRVGNPLTFNVTATDPGGPAPLVLSIAGSSPALPGTASFTDNGSGNGTFSWTPSAAEVNTYQVTFRARDTGGSGLFVDQTVSITVTANSAPLLATIGNRSVTVPNTLNFSVSATDADGPTPLMMSIVSSTPALPAAAVFTDNGGGNGTLNWPTETPHVESYQVTFRAREAGGVGLFDDETITITVNPAGGGGSGSITGSSSYKTGTSSLANFTTEGTGDWIHWGLSTSSSVNRKSGGGNQFSNLTTLGGASLARFFGNALNWTTVSWTDGTPTTTQAGFPGGVYTATTLGGYQFTAPADTTTRLVKVYLGGSSSISQVTATLSDNSATPAVVTLQQTSGADHHVVEFAYKAASANQTLTIKQLHTGGTTNIIGIQGATLSLPLTLPFTDDFNDGNANGWSFIDETPTASNWSVTGNKLRQNNRIQSVLAIEESYHLGSYAYLFAGTSLTDYDFQVTAQMLGSGFQDDVGVLFRYKDPLNYYRLTLNARYAFARLEKQVNGVFSPLATNSRGYVPGLNSVIRVVVRGTRIAVSVDGDDIFSVEDSSHANGSIGLYTQELADFDDVSVIVPTTTPQVVLATPLAHLTQSGTQIVATARAENVPVNGYVQFLLDGGNSQQDSTPPYSATYSGVAEGKHTVEAVLRNSSNAELDRDMNQVFGVGGDYILAIGDSITEGVGDAVDEDNTSLSERIIGAQGYHASLTDLLDLTRVEDNNLVFNEGIGGDSSFDVDQLRLASVKARHPNMDRVLLMLGTNDALASRGSGQGCTGAGCNGTFKGYMQAIIDKLRFDDYPTNSVPSGVAVHVARIPPAFISSTPWTSTTNNTIRTYNSIVQSELVGITQGPNFFDHFMASSSVNLKTLFADTLHPNALGYEVMAALWHNALETTQQDLPFVMSGLVKASGTVEPQQNLMELGDRPYLEETHTLTFIPAELSLGRWIMVNDSEYTRTDQTGYITFTADRPVTVFVAFDAGSTNRPDWMSSFNNSGLTVSSTHPNAPTYNLYSRNYAAGTISLGGASRTPAANVDANMLVVVVEN